MNRLSPLCLVLMLAVGAPGSSAEIRRGEMFGYLLFDGERVPEEFNAGFSFYAAAWPLVDHYSGHDFQTGLLGTWMFPLWEPGQKPKEECYTDIEGGLGRNRLCRVPVGWDCVHAAGGLPEAVPSRARLHYHEPGSGLCRACRLLRAQSNKESFPFEERRRFNEQ